MALLEVRFVLDGERSSFDQRGFHDALAARFPTAVDIALRVTAGSVIIDATLTFATQAAALAARDLIDSTPSETMQRVWFGSSGSGGALLQSEPVTSVALVAANGDRSWAWQVAAGGAILLTSTLLLGHCVWRRCTGRNETQCCVACCGISLARRAKSTRAIHDAEGEDGWLQGIGSWADDTELPEPPEHAKAFWARASNWVGGVLRENSLRENSLRENSMREGSLRESSARGSRLVPFRSLSRGRKPPASVGETGECAAGGVGMPRSSPSDADEAAAESPTVRPHSLPAPTRLPRPNGLPSLTSLLSPPPADETPTPLQRASQAGPEPPTDSPMELPLSPRFPPSPRLPPTMGEVAPSRSSCGDRSSQRKSRSSVGHAAVELTAEIHSTESSLEWDLGISGALEATPSLRPGGGLPDDAPLRSRRQSSADSAAQPRRSTGDFSDLELTEVQFL